MKCVKNPTTGEIKRVSEFEAKRLAAYGWEYVSKGEWKRSVRPNLTAIKVEANKAATNLIMEHGFKAIAMKASKPGMRRL